MQPGMPNVVTPQLVKLFAHMLCTSISNKIKLEIFASISKMI